MPPIKKPATAIKTKKTAGPALPALAAPAKRALENNRIKNLKQLSGYSEVEILQFHGMGKSSIPILVKALQAAGLSFKKMEAGAKTTKPSATDSVNDYMKKLEHPLKNVAAALRQLLLAAHKNVGEEISWNAPSFFYTGPMKPFNPKEYKRFIVGFNFFKKDCIRLVFLSGAKLKDPSGLLEGDYADGRRLALFYSINDLKTKGKSLQQLVRQWMLLPDK